MPSSAHALFPQSKKNNRPKTDLYVFSNSYVWGLISLMKARAMIVFILACLTACVLFFLVIVCVHCIKIEKNILEMTDLVEDKVLKMYDVKK
jgi:hypothetical protein